MEVAYWRIHFAPPVILNHGNPPIALINTARTLCVDGFMKGHLMSNVSKLAFKESVNTTCGCL